MRNGIRLIMTLAIALATCLPTAQAASDSKATIIAVPGMHCGGCAKKCTDQIKQVPGVEIAEADLQSKTIKVIAKANKTISPKALWEAVEKADKVPTKLEGPSGTFTDKPKS